MNTLKKIYEKEIGQILVFNGSAAFRKHPCFVNYFLQFFQKFCCRLRIVKSSCNVADCGIQIRRSFFCQLIVEFKCHTFF